MPSRLACTWAVVGAEPLVEVVTSATAVLLLTTWATFCPVKAPLNVIVNGPPVLPVTVTLLDRLGIVFRFVCTSLASVAAEMLRAEVADNRHTENVVLLP